MKAVSENDRRIDEINRKLPQIKEINDALYSTGKELIGIITSGRGADVSGKIEELKRNNLGAQAMARKILTDNGYPADYLDIRYSCPKCHDTGYFGDQFCDCFRQLCGKLSADQLNKSAHLKLSSFETFSLSYYKGEDYTTMKNIFDLTRQFAETFGAWRRASVSREISKVHEETLRGTLEELAQHFAETEPRGEFVIVVEGLNRKTKNTDTLK